MRTLIVLTVLWGGGFESVGAQAPQLTVIRAGRLVDVLTGEVATNRTIFITGDRIDAIRGSDAAIPTGATVVDLREHTVLPGLIDGHTHLIDGPESEGPLMTSGAEDALRGVKHAQVTLLAGFTTVRDVGTYRAFTDVALRDAINAGVITGPRMSVAGAYVTVSSGGGAYAGVAPDVHLDRSLRFGVANSPDEMRERVRELLNGGADFIKIIATGAVLTRGTQPGVAEYSEAEIRAAVEEAAKYGARVTAHAHGAQGIINAVRAGVHSIEHGSFLDEEGIRLMRERGTYLVADIYNADYIAAEGKARGWPDEYLRKNDDTAEAQRQAFRRAVQGGVPIAFGTDAGVFPHGWNARQLPYMVRYGMTPIQALQAATIGTARSMGWDDRVGSITPGKYADVIAVRGDPLRDLTVFERVAFVMKGGVIVRQ